METEISQAPEWNVELSPEHYWFKQNFKKPYMAEFWSDYDNAFRGPVSM